MSRIKIDKLPYKEFLESFRKVPRAAVSIEIVNRRKQILLTKRKENPFKDFWHLPGSFIFRKESIKECIKRILKEELGYKNNFSFEQFFISEDIDRDPRGHVLDLIYKVKINSSVPLTLTPRTKEFKYFDKLPSDIGFNHADVLKKLGF